MLKYYKKMCELCYRTLVEDLSLEENKIQDNEDYFNIINKNYKNLVYITRFNR